ncbi:MAG: hypothetical protein IJZ39_11965 [Oscillospiraceae bacterium]|nr:hypothetical protein [Oscillospiraceae bacterium]
MMKKMIVLLLMAILLLAGCATEEMTDATEGQIQYEWMAGESPVSPRRTGLLRAGLNATQFEVTDHGFYYLYSDRNGGGTYILYNDDGSDTFIKLCGRADCTHDNPDCNAYIGGSKSDICYWDGYLYVFTEDPVQESTKLIRMNPDGSNRVDVLDTQAFAEEMDADFAQIELMTDGYIVFALYAWEEVEEGHLDGVWLQNYYYALDGSMEAPEAHDAVGGPLYSCGDVILAWGYIEDSGENGSFFDWDPETDTSTFLCHHPGQPGWYGETEAYYYKNGALRRLTYATGKEEAVIEAGLTGEYYATILPDCILMVYDEYGDTSDKNLYFYNWEFELVDTVAIDYPFHDDRIQWAIAGETAERIILTDHFQGLPRYYIEKSELGTGNAKIHTFKLLDLEDEQEYWQEILEDKEWLENG